ncbi:MAG: ABC transporter ATP-binding protein [Alphaproteobacteria bacterium]
MTAENAEPLLACRKVDKYYGALAAVSKFDLDVWPGDVVGIGGPNGAGKTTFLDVISGISPATGGEIIFDGEDIARLSPDRICHRGIARTYQLNAGFDSLSIRENVLVGAAFGSGEGLIPSLRFSRQMRENVNRALELCRLTERANQIVRDIPVLDRKLLMLAGAVATSPKLLLIDEPVGGLNPFEIDLVMEIVSGLIEEGMTVMLIEHVMRFLLQLSRRVVIMHHGEKIYEGDPEALVSNERVVEVYLGEGTANRLKHLMAERGGHG